MTCDNQFYTGITTRPYTLTPALIAIPFSTPNVYSSWSTISFSVTVQTKFSLPWMEIQFLLPLLLTRL